MTKETMIGNIKKKAETGKVLTVEERGFLVEDSIRKEYNEIYKSRKIKFSEEYMPLPSKNVVTKEYLSPRYTNCGKGALIDMVGVDEFGKTVEAYEIYDGSYCKGKGPVLERTVNRIVRLAMVKTLRPNIKTGLIVTDADVYNLLLYSYPAVLAEQLGVDIIYIPREKYFTGKAEKY